MFSFIIITSLFSIIHSNVSRETFFIKHFFVYDVSRETFTVRCTSWKRINDSTIRLKRVGLELYILHVLEPGGSYRKKVIQDIKNLVLGCLKGILYGPHSLRLHSGMPERYRILHILDFRTLRAAAYALQDTANLGLFAPPPISRPVRKLTPFKHATGPAAMLTKSPKFTYRLAGHPGIQYV